MDLSMAADATPSKADLERVLARSSTETEIHQQRKPAQQSHLRVAWEWDERSRTTPSRVKCFWKGKPVSHAKGADCHGRPPFWDWWRDYRNCFASNICLHRGQFTLYSGSAPAEQLGLPSAPAPLACSNWHAGSANAVAVAGPPPSGNRQLDAYRQSPRQRSEPLTVWYRQPALFTSRILPGHYGHDVLNNYYYLFISFVEAGLEEWLEPGRAERAYLFLTDGDDGRSASWLDTVRYDDKHPGEWHVRHCFDKAMLSAAHTHGLDLIFLRASASRAKQWAWSLYRGLWLRRTAHEACGSSSRDCHLPSAPPLRPLPVACGAGHPPLKITILHRATVPGSSTVLFANGRGRRITNQPALAAALAKWGTVREADPGSLSLRAQQQLMRGTDVLITRMSSTTVGAMYMERGGLCLELEAADPSHLYYDHHATYQELADVAHCQKECRPPERLLKFSNPESTRLCIERCARVIVRNAALLHQPDGYLRSRGGESWFLNWWLADAAADVDSVIELIDSHACRASAHTAADANDAKGQRTIPIEPLVGHLRHPEFHCLGKQRDTLERMFSASYILLPDARDLRLRRETSGRRLFFDAGASIYGTCALGCQKWFVESYRAKGIQFDRIIGWEMSAIDHERLWRGADGYPSAMHPRVTYYNTRAEADPTSGDNPLVHIAQIARPEDYVVFKLDVDHNELEVRLIQQLLASPLLLSLIDELFWEHHVYGSPLRRTRVSFMGSHGIGWGNHTPSPGTPHGGLHDSYALFTALRQAGVRAHSWI